MRDLLRSGLHGDSDGLIEDSVQPLHKGGGVLEGDTFEEQRLVEEKPGGILDAAAARISQQLSDDLVIRVDFERGLEVGQAFLAHGLHHLAHASRGLVLVRDDDRGAIGEARGGAHLLDGFPESGADLFKQWLEFFTLFRRRLVLEVLRG